MKKKYIALSVVAVALAAAYYFTPSIETIVKKVVHKYGSQITGTDVNLNGFKLALTSGEGTINQITVANPNGYSAPYIFNLDEISVKVDIKSLTKDTIIIDKITVNKPIITYEMMSLTQNNINQIQKNVAQNTAAAEKTEQQDTVAAKPAEKSSTPSKKVIIKELVVDSGEIQVVANINGQANNLNVKLPTIIMKNIGGERKGASVAETISKVINVILSTASKTVVESQLADFKGVAEENLNQVVDGVKDRVGELGIFGK